VLLAGSRSAWLCYVLVLAGFAWQEARTLWRFSLWCAAAALLLALAGVVAWNGSARFHDRMARSLLVLHGTDRSVDTALSGRLDIWQVGAAMTAAHPVNGVGVRGFRYAYPQFAPADDHFVVSAEACGVGEGACHPHQLLLEILTNTGLLGLALWLAAAGLAWRAWRQVGAVARARVPGQPGAGRDAVPAELAPGVLFRLVGPAVRMAAGAVVRGPACRQLARGQYTGGSPGGRVLKRLCTHRYCSGASRTICSMQALTRAVSAAVSAPGKSSSGAARRSS
jgi:O-antigen ligase